jgi:hypothetical protein
MGGEKDANAAAGGGIPVRLARRQVAKDFTLWPVIACAPMAPEPELWSLEGALEDGFVSLEARAGDGAVRVRSRAAVPIAVLAGEPLGGLGRSACSRLVPPHGTVTVQRAAEPATPTCLRCVRSLAQAFRAEPGQVGFVWAVHDQAVALELLWPGWLGGGWLAQRVAAWAPWLLALEAGPDPVEGSQGDAAPERLIERLRAARSEPPGRGPWVHRVVLAGDRASPWHT